LTGSAKEPRTEIATVLALAEQACATPHDVALVGDDELTALLSVAVRLYAARAEALERFAPPIDVAKVTPTEALVTISEMIRAININMFDLSMWHERQGR
jgi:hypothetical protein